MLPVRVLDLELGELGGNNFWILVKFVNPNLACSAMGLGRWARAKQIQFPSGLLGFV